MEKNQSNHNPNKIYKIIIFILLIIVFILFGTVFKSNVVATQYSKLQLDYSNLYNDYSDLSAKCTSSLSSNQNIVQKDNPYRLPREIPIPPNIQGISFLVKKDIFALSYPGITGSPAGPTDSMVPCVPPASTSIVTTSFDPYTLKVGQIIQYKYQNGNIILGHRIIAIKQSDGEYCYVTQGDNVNRSDSCVKPSEVMRVELGVIYGTISFPDSIVKSNPDLYTGTPVNICQANPITCQ